MCLTLVLVPQEPIQINSTNTSSPLTKRTLGTTPDATSDLLELAKSLPEHSQRSFKLCRVTFEDVMKEIHHLRSDCLTGVDQIPVKFVKLISEHIASPLSSSLSNQRYLNCGVPQESCLGPLLFVMYTSTLFKAIERRLPRLIVTRMIPSYK